MNKYAHHTGKSFAMMTAEKNDRKNKATEILVNSPSGVTVKELCVDLKVSSDTVRSYLKEFMDKGDVIISGREGKTIIYKWAEPGDKVTKENTIMPEHIGGKEFTEPKPALNTVQGDVVWVSSRSGDGQFFRYLVVAPWDRKATVIGVVAENHPVLNLNSTRFVYIGNDPETGEGLYADLSNTCSRGYAQFGEKLMTITDEHMSDVKTYLARYYHMANSSSDSDTERAKLQQIIKNISKESEKYKLIANESLKLKTDYDALHEKALKQTDIINGYLAENDELKDHNQKLNDELQAANERNAELQSLVDQLTESTEGVSEYSNEYVEKLQSMIGSLNLECKILETKLECKEEYITTLKQLAFTVLKGGN